MAASLRPLIGLAAVVLLPLGCATSHPDESCDLTFHDRVHEDVQLSLADHRHFYSPLSLGLLAGGIAAAAPLANGSADEDVRQWYDQRIRRDQSEGAATAAGIVGQAWVVVPVGLEFARLLGHIDAEALHDGGLFEWSNRSLRACAVGYPPILALFGLLGAGRPSEFDSRWRPFYDFHGVSGHTFVGAVPFLTAAALTGNPFLKVPLIAGSFAMGWSRIHDQKHYLSQVLLGWGIAALATWSVDRTQESTTWTIAPTAGPEGTGVALEWRY